MSEANLSKEVLDGIKAHNAHKPEPVYNENWNKANATGAMRARQLCMAALSFKYGICSGSMKHRKVTKAIVNDYLLYSGNADMRAWAYVSQVSSAS